MIDLKGESWIVPIERSASNTTVERLIVPARGTATQRLLVQGKPTEVQVNDGTVPETQASVHIIKLDQSAPSILSRCRANSPPKERCAPARLCVR